MATLLNTVSPPANLSSKTKGSCGFSLYSQILNIPRITLKRGFVRVLASTQMTTTSKDAVFTLPNWRAGKSDSKSKELRLNDAFLYLEYMVGRGHKPDVVQATQLLYDLCKANKLRKAVRVMEMMIGSYD